MDLPPRQTVMSSQWRSKLANCVHNKSAGFTQINNFVAPTCTLKTPRQSPEVIDQQYRDRVSSQCHSHVWNHLLQHAHRTAKEALYAHQIMNSSFEQRRKKKVHRAHLGSWSPWWPCGHWNHEGPKKTTNCCSYKYGCGDVWSQFLYHLVSTLRNTALNKLQLKLPSLSEFRLSEIFKGISLCRYIQGSMWCPQTASTNTARLRM